VHWAGSIHGGLPAGIWAAGKHVIKGNTSCGSMVVVLMARDLAAGNYFAGSQHLLHLLCICSGLYHVPSSILEPVLQ
jgi:hypothetical protein